MSKKKEFEDAIENLSNSDSGHSSQMTPENSVSHSDDDDLDTLPRCNSSDNCPGLEESLEDIYRLLKMALNNCFEEAMDGTEKWLFIY